MAVLWWLSVATSASISIGLIIIYTGRALGFAFDDGCLYNVKFDFKIRIYRTGHGKYERPKQPKRSAEPTEQTGAAFKRPATKYV